MYAARIVKMPSGCLPLLGGSPSSSSGEIGRPAGSLLYLDFGRRDGRPAVIRPPIKGIVKRLFLDYQVRKYDSLRMLQILNGTFREKDYAKRFVHSIGVRSRRKINRPKSNWRKIRGNNHHNGHNAYRFY